MTSTDAFKMHGKIRLSLGGLRNVIPQSRHRGSALVCRTDIVVEKTWPPFRTVCYKLVKYSHLLLNVDEDLTGEQLQTEIIYICNLD